MSGTLDLGTRTLPLGSVTHVMGVINVSPDSKNVHTVARSVDEVLLMAERYRQWGASLIDLGGQSSHYDNPTIDEADEISRIVPAVEALVAEDHIVAIDTWKAGVAEAALRSGALIVNDTGGLKSPDMRSVVSNFDAAAIAVYIEGENPHDVMGIEISSDKTQAMARSFQDLLSDLAASGITNVILDPGIALNYRSDYESYTRMQLEVIAGSETLKDLGKPVLIPIPRKRDFHRVIAYMALALEHKADMIRVHDVAVACDLARLFDRAG